MSSFPVFLFSFSFWIGFITCFLPIHCYRKMRFLKLPIRPIKPVPTVWLELKLACSIVQRLSFHQKHPVDAKELTELGSLERGQFISMHHPLRPYELPFNSGRSCFVFTTNILREIPVLAIGSS